MIEFSIPPLRNLNLSQEISDRCWPKWERQRREIYRETASRLKLKEGEEAWVESPFGKIKARVKCSEGLHPQLVAISSGQGHYAYGKWQKGIGVNPYELIGVDFDRISGQAAFFNTRVKVYK